MRVTVLALSRPSGDRTGAVSRGPGRAGGTGNMARLASVGNGNHLTAPFTGTRPELASVRSPTKEARRLGRAPYSNHNSGRSVRFASSAEAQSRDSEGQESKRAGFRPSRCRIPT
jgi:hypothetical protein